MKEEVALVASSLLAGLAGSLLSIRAAMRAQAMQFEHERELHRVSAIHGELEKIEDTLFDLAHRMNVLQRLLEDDRP